MQFWTEACMTLPEKESHELRDAFQFLQIWQDGFRSRHGELQALSHLSNPDDPPDVIAHFSPRDVAIEITTIDPPHIRQSDALHRKTGSERGRSGIPISYKPKDRQEALEMMYCPGATAWENVSERDAALFKSINERVAKKMSSLRVRQIPPGIILLTGQMDGSIGEAETVQRAFSGIREAIHASQAWTLAFCHQWNHLHYFSVVDAPGLDFEIRKEIS